MPGDYEENLSNFDKLVIIKSFRMEMIQMSISEFVIREMGQFYVEAPNTSMEIIYEKLSVNTPLIFVLTPGADPTATLLKFAADKDFSDKLHPISLGQG
jgi:dynein heavy chain, axonemal